MHKNEHFLKKNSNQITSNTTLNPAYRLNTSIQRSSTDNDILNIGHDNTIGFFNSVRDLYSNASKICINDLCERSVPSENKLQKTKNTINF